ncbi:hypothetical protein LTR85_007524 [Meristemomyces frigidus]|nr:hypothetical protein LTR85_007524 [Meristemomyces frigidus]
MSKRLRAEDSDANGDISSREGGSPSKRQRPDGLGLGSSEAEESESEPTSMSDGDAVPRSDKEAPKSKKKRVTRRELNHVAVVGSAYPRSSYDGWEPKLPPVSEEKAVAELTRVHRRLHAESVPKPDYTYLRLEDFSIFRPVTKGVPFSILTIDGYGDDDVTTLRDRICIQSPEAEYNDVWYQLGKPAQEYRRFHTPFVWLAHFMKYYVDYLLSHEQVALTKFRADFNTWLAERYGDTTEFASWLGEAKLSDFRTTVAAHVGFLWKECYSIDDREIGLCKHPIWGEVDPLRLKAVPEQPSHEKHTVVTPFVYDSFKHMYFASHMEARPITNRAILEAVKKRKQEFKLTPLGTASQRDTPHRQQQSSQHHSAEDHLDVHPGDVVCVRPDTESRWKNQAVVWYAYVQSVRPTPEGDVLDVLWLYVPGDTTLGLAYYPFQNELFLSDNCACGKEAINVDSVTGKLDVTWFATDPNAVAGFFVRQKFRTIHDEDTYDFMSLKESDFSCRCDRYVSMFTECQSKYNINDTVLVRQWNAEQGEDSLEPAQILAFDCARQHVVLRRLARKSSTHSRARPNELVLTDDTFKKGPSMIVRRCHVRFINAKDALEGHLATPYDRNGAGDLFFIVRTPDNRHPGGFGTVLSPATGVADQHDCAKATDSMPLPTEGWDPAAAAADTKLKGMGIFCGGGNFDRGLEEGGAVKFLHGVDWARCALHSYRANTDAPDDLQFWLGSVNDYLAQTMAGSTKAMIARLGDFEFLSAGSPCPGFSGMQKYRESSQSLMNASLVASVVSFVDFYSPKYCMLENVPGMTKPPPGYGKDQNVFSQVLAAFVAMGYQVQQFLMDAWSFGSSQQRTRVFIIASAPGSEPLPAPQHTHAHAKAMVVKSLGESSNGMRFGVRRNDFTTFPHVSASKAAADLPAVGDAQPQLCPRFPDHRTPNDHSFINRTRMAMVPILPHGANIVRAYYAGLLSGEPEQFVKGLNKVRFHTRSGCYARVYQDGLFPTILTHLHMQDGKAGRCMHWQEHRSLTIMEARRAQGFLNHEVLVGAPTEQMKIVGNSVDRVVALALGLALRVSWERSALIRVTEAEQDASATPTAAQPPLSVVYSSLEPDEIEWARQSQDEQSSPGRGEREWVEQSRNGTLRLSDAEVKEVREGGGFKAIMRILSIREGGEITGMPSRLTPRLSVGSPLHSPACSFA